MMTYDELKLFQIWPHHIHSKLSENYPFFVNGQAYTYLFRSNIQVQVPKHRWDVHKFFHLHSYLSGIQYCTYLQFWMELHPLLPVRGNLWVKRNPPTQPPLSVCLSVSHIIVSLVNIIPRHLLTKLLGPMCIQ